LAFFDRVSTKVRDTQMALKQNISKIGKRKCSVTVTQDNKFQCDRCHKKYNILYTVTRYMRAHLIEHGIDKYTARERQIWIENSNDVILNQDCTITCRHCDKVFPKNYVCLMKHLVTHDEVDVPLKFQETG